MKFVSLLTIGLLATLTQVGYAGQAAKPAAKGAARFEVTSLRAVRTPVVNTIAALQKKDLKGAQAAFEGYQSDWLGVEVYVSTRSMDMYNDIEHNWETKVADDLKAPMPDLAKALSDAQSLLTAYDGMLAMVEKAAPLNPLFDDVARLRMERTYLRNVPPALKAGDVTKARKSFQKFDDNWDNIEDLIKARSRDAYDGIEKSMVAIEKALMPAAPNYDEVNMLVTGVMMQYNAVLADVVKDARK